jgi:DNA polymerase-1
MALGLFYEVHGSKKPAEKKQRVPRKQTDGDTPKPPRISKAQQLSEQLAQAAALGCQACTLNNEPLQSPKMLPTGSNEPIIYILGEAPGADEDREGEQFVGKSGRLLRSHLPEGWAELTRWNNTLRCRPPSNRDPTPLETACCRSKQISDIEQTKPKVIITVGRLALQWLTGRDNIWAWHSRFIPVTVGTHECWAYAIYHPAFIIRNSYESKWSSLFAFSLKSFFNKLETTDIDAPAIADPGAYSDHVHLLLEPDLEKAQEWLNKAAAQPTCAIDIETNALRPYKAGAKILSIAVGTYDDTYVIPIDHSQARWTAEQKPKLLAMLKHFILQSGVKFAHNLAFELEWLSLTFGKEILFETQWGDTQSQGYVIDARAGALSLDDLVYQYFGFGLKAQNQLDKANLDNEPLEKVLLYNGMDTKWTDLLRWAQEQRLQDMGLTHVYDFHLPRVIAIVRAQQKGLMLDTPLIVDYYKKLSEKITATRNEIAALPEVKQFEQAQDKTFNPASTKDLTILLRDQLNFKQGQRRDGKYSTDEEALKQIDHPLPKAILTLRGTNKLRSTYIDPFLPPGIDSKLPNGGELVWPDGLVHCWYHHLRTITGRLSCAEPNMQNFPSREHKDVRSIITAPKLYWMVAFDAGQIEARVIAMASKDPTLVKFICEGFDIHTYWSEKLAFAFPTLVGGKRNLQDKKALKKWRNESKTAWTFALFYGSMLESVARAMGLGRESNGKWIAPKELGALYDEFWSMFNGVHEWQKRLITQAKIVGYVETLMGRRRYLPMSDNEAINSPIQGTASDIVVDAMVRLARIAYETGKDQYQANLNVHDDLTFYLPDASLEDDIELIGREMVRIRPEWAWVNVPLIIECKAGRNWGTQQEVHVFNSNDYGFHHL